MAGEDNREIHAISIVFKNGIDIIYRKIDHNGVRDVINTQKVYKVKLCKLNW